MERGKFSINRLERLAARVALMKTNPRARGVWRLRLWAGLLLALVLGGAELAMVIGFKRELAQSAAAHDWHTGAHHATPFIFPD